MLALSRSEQKLATQLERVSVPKNNPNNPNNLMFVFFFKVSFSDLCPETLKFFLGLLVKRRGVGGSNQDDEIKRLRKIEMQRCQRANLPFYFVSCNGSAIPFSDINSDAKLFVLVFPEMNDKTRALLKRRPRDYLPKLLMFKNPEFSFHQKLRKN